MSDTDEIIRVTREIERIDRELLSLEEPLPRPIDINAPVPHLMPGWMGDVEKEEAQAERKEIWAKYEAKKEARSKRSQQLNEERAVLSKHREKLLSGAAGQSINGAAPKLRKHAKTLIAERRSELEEANGVKPIVWLGTDRDFGDAISKLFRKGFIQGKDWFVALKIASEHFTHADGNRFDPESIRESIRIREKREGKGGPGEGLKLD